MVAVVTVTTRTMTTLIPEMIAGICGQSFNHCSLQHRIYLNYNRYNINHPNFLTCIFEPPVLVCSGCIHSVKLINVLQHLPFTHFISATSDTFRYCTAYLKSPGISPAQWSWHYHCGACLPRRSTAPWWWSKSSTSPILSWHPWHQPIEKPTSGGCHSCHICDSQCSHTFYALVRVQCTFYTMLQQLCCTMFPAGAGLTKHLRCQLCVCVCADFILCKYSIDLDGSYT